MLFGELAEWLKALVLKTSDPVRDRGFESHILREISTSNDHRFQVVILILSNKFDLDVEIF